VFLGAKIVSIGHTGIDIPGGTKRLSKLPAPVKVLETIGEGAIVSVLENGSNTFLVIVNRDFKQTMKLVLEVDDTVKKVQKDGTLIAANEYTNATEVEPGDAAIYMFPAVKK
jgi:hypothetical protein